MTPQGGETCVRVVCNSCLNPLDVQTARAAKWGMHREWCASLPAEIGTPMKARLQRLYDFLRSGLLKVKVLPDTAFGLIHGKAGVITRTDGSRVCFIGSAEEDMAVARDLVHRNHTRHGLFFAHLGLEKALKAHVCRATKDIAPRLHNLIRLSELAELHLQPAQVDILAEMNSFNVEGKPFTKTS